MLEPRLLRQVMSSLSYRQDFQPKGSNFVLNYECVFFNLEGAADGDLRKNEGVAYHKLINTIYIIYDLFNTLN